MTTSYLEQLLDKCDSLKLVLNPPHPGAFIQGRADQAQILLVELEQEISEIEKRDAPTFEVIELQGKEDEWVGFEPEIYLKLEQAQEEFEEAAEYQDWLLNDMPGMEYA